MMKHNNGHVKAFVAWCESMSLPVARRSINKEHTITQLVACTTSDEINPNQNSE